MKQLKYKPFFIQYNHYTGNKLNLSNMYHLFTADKQKIFNKMYFE